MVIDHFSRLPQVVDLMEFPRRASHDGKVPITFTAHVAGSSPFGDPGYYRVLPIYAGPQERGVEKGRTWPMTERHSKGVGTTSRT